MAEEKAEKTYSELAAMIESVEAGYSPTEIVNLDLNEMLKSEQNPNPIKYSDMLAIIEEFEGPQRGSRVAIGKPGTTQQAYQQPAQQQQPVVPQVPQPQQQQQQPMPQIVQPQPANGSVAPREKRKIAAKLELGKAIDQLGELEAEIKMRSISTDDLVLPNLSVPDQISELERIIEGLRTGVFDKDHLDTVRQELQGLDKIVQLQKAKMKVSGRAGDSEEIMIRDQRLKSALELLRQQGVR